ncbi:MAG: hypothetical protein DRQ88_11820 [Epsilonproteobacteria bacterium]|nr:MAG: hypothetical protein DRQ89_09700 [Campylobacterota bacterium]RLA63874.1 MAG: hypothetical protein DRQ88_11820 [Campylobacterota bacterium]
MKKTIFLIIFVLGLWATKWALWDMKISSGKIVGHLTHMTQKGNIPFLKTWEGTVDEGSGDKLTTYFSVKDEVLAKKLFTYEDKEVVLYYDEHLLGWPRKTKLVVFSWKAKKAPVQFNESKTLEILEKTLFCSFLGSLLPNQDLYQKVKDFIKEQNLFIYNQYQKCNN